MQVDSTSLNISRHKPFLLDMQVDSTSLNLSRHKPFLLVASLPLRSQWLLRNYRLIRHANRELTAIRKTSRHAIPGEAEVVFPMTVTITQWISVTPFFRFVITVNYKLSILPVPNGFSMALTNWVITPFDFRNNTPNSQWVFDDEHLTGLSDIQ